jgi:DNA-binding NtrC family response regulator
MKASDLHLLELLDIDTDQGSIRFKDRRMLLWDADAFGSLRHELIDSLGVELARPILKRFGFANGYRDALMTEQLLRWASDEEWWLTCPTLQRHEGKVQPDVKHLKVDREANVFEMQVDWTFSYEAEQHLRVLGRADAPVCWTLAGVASGFATALMGEECIVVETECAAMGAPGCKVVGKTRQAWATEGDRVAADYKAQPLASELSLLDRESRTEQHRQIRRERERAAQNKRPVAHRPSDLVARSAHMENVLTLCETVARVDSPVLITGESGVGKERIARFIHEQSEQKGSRFTIVHCGALPEAQLESELFGQLEASFPGAHDKLGLLERPECGTLYLDEVGAMSPALQVKLLRVLQDGEVWPVGASAPRPVQVRVLASTNRDLEERVQQGQFRTDLLYRLNVITVDIPPLRTRREDILPLARFYIQRACERAGVTIKTLSAEAAQALAEHPWPDNVHELENAMDRAVILTAERSKIGREDLPPAIRSVSAKLRNVHYDQIMPIAELEKRYVLEVLDRYNGNRTKTAKALGIGANTLWRKLKGWGVPPARGDA